MSPIQHVPTGVPGLDAILGAGLPNRHTIVVTGEPGCGKTVLCGQIACLRAAQGDSVVFATVTSESHEKLVSALGTFSFFNHDHVGNELFFVSLYSWLQKGAKEARETVLRTVRERKAKLLVIDGLRAVRDLWHDEAMLRDFLYDLVVGLAALDCLTLITTEYPIATLQQLPEATTVDGIISLSTHEMRNSVFRRAQVVKLRGQRHLMGRHVMLMGESGVTIHPRIESHSAHIAPPAVETARATFGLAELDALCHGGLPRRSATLLAGNSGIGKTLLSLSFAAAGAAAGEPTYFLSLAEAPAALVARAARVGLDLQPLLDSGALRIAYRSPLELEADELLAELMSTLESMKARRFVLDSIDEFEPTLTERDRLSHVLIAWTSRLRALGVTSLFLKKIGKFVGTELDFTNTPISTITDNLVLLRHVELSGKLHRVLSILNLRDSAFDQAVREFQISDQGIRVLAPLANADGVLTGLARVRGVRPDPR